MDYDKIKICKCKLSGKSNLYIVQFLEFMKNSIGANILLIENLLCIVHFDIHLHQEISSIKFKKN